MSQNTLRYLKTDPNARYQGYMYFFREGFCWTDVNSTYLKARIKRNGVFDVLSMSLFTQINIPDWYFVCMINSKLLSFYVDNFINNTSHFQINDARQLPIIIPSNEQLITCHNLFQEAITLKKEVFNNPTMKSEIEKRVLEIEQILDDFVEKLYYIV